MNKLTIGIGSGLRGTLAGFSQGIKGLVVGDGLLAS